MILQLWHVGRVSSSSVNGLQPIAPSAVEPGGTSVYIFEGLPNGLATFIPAETPKAMESADFEILKNDFIQAAKNAMEAGFDGVEIHGANGYLLDQFLRSTTNHRTDEYGGSKENKIRLLLEIATAVADAVGADKVGVRMSPFIKSDPTEDPEILQTILLASAGLNELKIAYIHIAETDWSDGPSIDETFRKILRKTFTNTIIITGGKTPDAGEKLLENDYADLIGFGRSFIANPDFPNRVFHGAELSVISDGNRLFGGGDHIGYTDYTSMEKQEVSL